MAEGILQSQKILDIKKPSQYSFHDPALQIHRSYGVLSLLSMHIQRCFFRGGNLTLNISRIGSGILSFDQDQEKERTPQSAFFSKFRISCI
jgi:hypothetical protein